MRVAFLHYYMPFKFIARVAQKKKVSNMVELKTRIIIQIAEKVETKKKNHEPTNTQISTIHRLLRTSYTTLIRSCWSASQNHKLNII